MRCNWCACEFGLCQDLQRLTSFRQTCHEPVNCALFLLQTFVTRVKKYKVPNKRGNVGLNIDNLNCGYPGQLLTDPGDGKEKSCWYSYPQYLTNHLPSVMFTNCGGIVTKNTRSVH